MIYSIISYLKYNPEISFGFWGVIFWIFFLIILGANSLLYKNRKARNFFLFIASLYFYYRMAGSLVIILGISILMNYIGAIAISKIEKQGNKLFTLALAVFGNLCLFSLIKYGLNLSIPKFPLHLNLENAFLNSPQFSGLAYLIKPLGLFIFSLQGISYLFDVYRKKTACLNFLDLGCYMSFFPQLFIGPISKSHEFCPQLKQYYQVSKTDFSNALALILSGLIKVLIIGNFLAKNLINPLFENPDAFSSFEIWISLFGLSVLLYNVFSGYTNIARGLALILGFQIPINFKAPFSSTSLSDFFRHWNISLSDWFKEYLYIPLGGNKKGRTRTILNIILCLILGCFFFGLKPNLLLWASCLALFLCLEKMVGKNKLPRLLAIFIGFTLISLSWLVLRANNLDQAWMLASRLIEYTNPYLIPDLIHKNTLALAIILLSLCYYWFGHTLRQRVLDLFIAMPMILKFFIAFISIIAIAIYQDKSFEIFINSLF